MRIAGFEKQSIVDGPGFRFVVFFQGCQHKCKGCHNPNTWDVDGGIEMSKDQILKQIDEAYYIDGVTISGGEPFLQFLELDDLLKDLKKRGHHIICYTGFLFEEIMADPIKKQVLLNIDILIDGKFKLEEKSIALRFRGSKNQRVIDVKKTMEQNKIVEIDW